MDRRGFLVAAAALAAAGAGLARAAAPAAGGARYLVPGYVPESAHYKGRPLAEQAAFTRAVPRGYDGLLTLVTRIDERDGAVKRALLPVAGHEITVDPAGGHAFFSALDHATMVSFDPDSLELGVLTAAHADGYVGGGHAVYTPDGGQLIATERREYVAYKGRPEDHFGRLVVRDAATLRVLEVYDSHGIAPHQMVLLADEPVLAVAHYGSTAWPDDDDRGGLPHIVEPCLTLIDLGNGRLLHKEVSPDRRFDLRHLAARGRDRIFAIQGRLARFADAQAAMGEWDGVYQPDVLSAPEGLGYLPAPLLRFDLSAADTHPTASRTENPLLMRYGQSIVYDPVHDEAIATFPSRHCVIVFAGGDGQVRRVIRADRLGLEQPRGIALHPDGAHYAVSGYWQNLFLFRRGSHELARVVSNFELFFGHSHLTVA